MPEFFDAVHRAGNPPPRPHPTQVPPVIQVETKPQPPSCPKAERARGALVRRDATERFTAWVMSRHKVRAQDGGIPMCTCGYPARHCEYLQQAHVILGHPSPWARPGPGLPYVEV